MKEPNKREIIEDNKKCIKKEWDMLEEEGWFE